MNLACCAVALSTFVAAGYAGQVVRLEASDSVTMLIDLTRSTDDPQYAVPELPAGIHVAAVGAYPWNIHRVLLKFDLSSLPEDTRVQSALLHLDVVATFPVQEGEIQLAQRFSFDSWDSTAVDRVGYITSSISNLGATTRPLSGNNTAQWMLNLDAWDIPADLADNQLTIQLRYAIEGDFVYRGTNYYSHLAPTLRPYLELDVVQCDSIDFNNDTSLFDPQDIDAFLSVYSEGPCIPETATCNDIDFNNDTSLFDPCDIDSFLLVYTEGPCTLCGE